MVTFVSIAWRGKLLLRAVEQSHIIYTHTTSASVPLQQHTTGSEGCSCHETQNLAKPNSKTIFVKY